MKSKRKTVLSWLRKQAALLPEATYKAYHKYYEPRIEKNEEDKDVWRNGYLQDHSINHYRRMKKAYDTYGLAGVQGYLALYGFEVKIAA